MFPLKTAMLVVGRTNIHDRGFDNLAYTAESLNAIQIPYNEVRLDDLANFQLVLIIDNVNYKTFDGLAQKVRQKYPHMFMGWHQEKEVSNLFRRHKNHYDMAVSEETWCISSLKVWESIKACDFVICHNANDYSLSFYNIFSDKPCFSSNPFLPIEKYAKYAKSRVEKSESIAVGYGYGWRDGGFLGYMVAGQPKYKHYRLTRWMPKNMSDLQIRESQIIDNNFYKRSVEIAYVDGNRELMAQYFADTYVIINLREPTAGRTNALAGVVGTPMIGLNTNDVQQKLFPELCVDKYDLTEVDRLLNLLLHDEDFYMNCIQVIRENLWKVGVEESKRHLRENILKIYNVWKNKLP